MKIIGEIDWFIRAWVTNRESGGLRVNNSAETGHLALESNKHITRLSLCSLVKQDILGKVYARLKSFADHMRGSRTSVVPNSAAVGVKKSHICLWQISRFVHSSSEHA